MVEPDGPALLYPDLKVVFPDFQRGVHLLAELVIHLQEWIQPVTEKDERDVLILRVF